LFILFCVLVGSPNAPAQARTLRSSRFGGTRYVAARDLAAYYDLGSDLDPKDRRAAYRTAGNQLSFEAERRDLTVHGVTHWISAPVLSSRGQLWVATVDVLNTIDPVLRQGRSATKAPVRIVVLDAGHGGTDRGARGVKALEKDLTLDLSRRVERILAAASLTVIQTRTKDVTLRLEDRPVIAAKRKADLFISLHFNSGGSASGIETYCVPPAGAASTASPSRLTGGSTVAGNKHDEKNVWLAHAIQRQLLHRTGAADRGVRRARFQVLRDAPCPAVLVEAGFLSNRAEEQRILNPDYREKLAAAIAAGILDYKRTVE
jgi:N-acetylmuramoyl-L-alanine amidase